MKQERSEAVPGSWELKGGPLRSWHLKEARKGRVGWALGAGGSRCWECLRCSSVDRRLGLREGLEG